MSSKKKEAPHQPTTKEEIKAEQERQIKYLTKKLNSK